MKEKQELVEHKVDTKRILMAAWASFMFVYVYCDILSFHSADVITGVLAGKIGPFDVNQMSLFLFGLLLAIPGLMVLVTARAKAGLLMLGAGTGKAATDPAQGLGPDSKVAR
jgi:hypothetical protein